MTISLGRRSLAAAGMLAAGLALTTVVPADTADAAVTVRHFDGLHVVHDRATAQRFLHGTPRAFQVFMAAEGAKVRREAAAAGDPTSCVKQSGVIVTDFAQDSPAGYAIGDAGGCGGYAALWTNATRGASGTTTWREVIGTQDGWYCPPLKRFHVPSALVGDTCYSPRAHATKPYHQD